MTTNILGLLQIIGVATSLVTNTVEEPTDYARYEPGSPPGGWNERNFTLAIAYMVGVDPQAKWVVTTVKEVTTITFEWPAGTKRQESSERVVSENREYFRRGWIKSDPPTNNASYITIATNALYISDLCITNQMYGGPVNLTNVFGH